MTDGWLKLVFVKDNLGGPMSISAKPRSALIKQEAKQ
jgi:hypothetical protein